MTRTERILIADDDPEIRRSLREALADEGYSVRTVEDADAALAEIARAAPDVLISDVRMPGMTGLDLLRVLRERQADVDVILITAFDDMGTVASAMQHGAVDFLVKPIGLAQLTAVLQRVLDDRRYRQQAPLEGDSVGVGVLVGRDPSMIEVYKLIGRAAATRATVLIRGESGTGKEVVARAIHERSAAADQPFVAVNCAALPNSLLESELFGHVRGAFTGAHESRRGRFALAARGTILLDEIGDTSPDLQARLLRVIQDREFQPVGSDRTERTDARVIAATHQSLETLIAQRRFREDLYYRLRVVEIVLPALRQRLSDIPQLATTLLQRAADGLNVDAPVLAEDALHRLLSHSWPGNVRELENALTRALVIAAGRVIHAEHITLSLPGADSESPLASLEDVEREQVTRVLAATGGHKSRAADILGVSRPRLARLIEKYGIHVDGDA